MKCFVKLRGMAICQTQTQTASFKMQPIKNTTQDRQDQTRLRHSLYAAQLHDLKSCPPMLPMLLSCSGTHTAGKRLKSAASICTSSSLEARVMLNFNNGNGQTVI